MNVYRKGEFITDHDEGSEPHKGQIELLCLLRKRTRIMGSL